jgi:uncharacterized protein YqhQ
MLPIISGIGYEILKLSSKKPKNIILNLFAKPGLMLQRLTALEPDENQINIAIIALKASLEEDLSEHGVVNFIND